MKRQAIRMAAVVTILMAGFVAPVMACGCDSKPLEELIDRADHVFTAQAPGGAGLDPSKPFRVDVQKVYKGEVAESVEVIATEGPLACGITPEDDIDTFLASGDGDRVRIGTCLPQHNVADVEQILGAGHAPATTVAVGYTRVEPVYLAIGGMALTSVAGFLLLRRRAR